MSLQMKLRKANKEMMVEGKYADLVFKAGAAINATRLSGVSLGDRLSLQKAIDDNNLQATIIYDGIPVVGYRKIVNNLTQMRIAGTLDAMTDETYELLSSRFDFPRSDKKTYIKAYGNNYAKMIQNLVIQQQDGLSDVNRLAEALMAEKKVVAWMNLSRRAQEQKLAI